jgi:uncharacterized cupin superfamily protein
MAVNIKSITSVDVYTGPNALAGIRFRAIRQALGVRAWGMNVLEMDPHCEAYPAHDHQHDDQEEVYLVLEGSLVIQFDGHERVLMRGDLAHVTHDTKRKLVTRESSAVLLALGGVPGKAFNPTM